MNLDTAFWLRLTETLAVESALIAGGAWLVQRWVRSGAWKRAIWQIAIVSMVLLTLSELSGVGRGMSVALLGNKPVQKAVQSSESSCEPSWTVTETPSTPAISETSPAPVVAAIEALHAPPTEIRWPLGIWVLGIIVVLSRIAFAQALLIWLRFRWSKESDSQLNFRLAKLGKRLGISRRVSLFKTPGLASPIAFGWLRPSIGLPADFDSRFTTHQQDTMLAHEMGHLAERDPLWYLISDLASAFLWWLPFSWLARRQFQWASELAADEASFVLEDGPGTLAECLVTLARESLDTRPWAWMGITGNKSNFGQRVARLLERGKGTRAGDSGRAGEGHSSGENHRWPFILTKSALAIAVAFALLLGTGWLHGQGANPGSLKSLSESWKQSPAAAMVTAIEKGGNDAFDPPKALPHAAQPEFLPELFTKTWQFDSDQLLISLKTIDPELTDWVSPQGSSSQRHLDALRTYLARAGVDLNLPGKSTFVKPRAGLLTVRGSKEDIETVNKLMANYPKRIAQVAISVQYVDFNQASAKDLGLDWIIGNAANPDPSSGWKIGERRAIITDSRRDTLMASLQAHPEIKLLDYPRVTTLSGRQARLSREAETPIPFSSDTQKIGRTVDLITDVLPDMKTMHMVVVPQVSEAVLPTNGLSAAPEAFAVDLYDSQTVLVAQKGNEKWSAAFITVRLIDPAANLLNSLDQLPFATNSIPKQALAEIKTPDKLMPSFAANPPKVLFQVQHLDFDEALAKELGLDWIVGDAANPDPSSAWKIGECRAILTEVRRDAMLAHLKSHPEVPLSDLPNVTVSYQREIGVAGKFSVIPELLQDHKTLHLAATFRDLEAARLSDPATFVPNWHPPVVETMVADVYDSQTFLVVHKGKKKWTAAFITLRPVTSTGSLLNSPKDIPFATNSIPKQLVIHPDSLVLGRLQVQERVTETALKIFQHKFPNAKNLNTLTNAQTYLTAYLTNAGVKLEAPKTLIVNRRNGMALVRCAPDDKAIVNEAVAALNHLVPQVQIEARVLEIDRNSKNRSALDSLLATAGIELAPSPITDLVETANGVDFAKVRETQEVTNSLTGKLAGVLSDSQFRTVLEGLTKNGKADVLAAPKITATSDSEVNLSTIKSYFPAKLGSTVLPPLPEGVVVQFLPRVEDDRSVELAVTSTATEVIRSKSKAPQVQVRQVSDTLKIETGKTMVLCGLPNKDSQSGKDLVVFVTPRVIDSTGKQVKLQSQRD